CTMVMEADPPPLRQLRPDIDRKLDGIVGRCLARDRDQRWPTVADLARALLPFGTSQSSVHVDRAARVLRSRDLSPPTGGGAMPSGPVPERASLRAETVAAPSTPPDDAPAAEEPAVRGHASTQDSWGTTRMGKSARPAKRSRQGLLLVASIVLFFLVGAGLFA